MQRSQFVAIGVDDFTLLGGTTSLQYFSPTGFAVWLVGIRDSGQFDTNYFFGLGYGPVRAA